MRIKMQWILVLAPPLIWALQQQISFALTPTVCANRMEWWLHLITVLALLLTGSVAVLAWSEQKRLAGVSTDMGKPEETRAHFLTIAAMAAGVFFLFVILATELPHWFFGACER